MSDSVKAANAAEPAIDYKAMPRVLTRLNNLALHYPWLFAAAVACAVAAAALGLVTPRLLGEAVNQAYVLLLDEQAVADRSTLYSLLWGAAILIVLASGARGIFTGLQGYLGESIAQRVGYDLRLAYFSKLQTLDFAFHDQSHSGDLIARGMLDLEGVRAFLEMGVLRLITLLLLLGFGAWRLLSLDIWLGLLALCFVPVVIIRATGMGVRLRKTWLRLQELMSEMTLGMEENLQGVRVVRAFASQQREIARFDEVSEKALKVSEQRIATRVMSMGIMNLAFYSAMALVLWVGGQKIIAGSLSVGELTEILTFMMILQQPVRQVGMIVNAGSRATSAGGRLFDVLDSEPVIVDSANAKPLQIETGVLRFDSVSFSFSKDPQARPILQDISFTLAPGKTLGIVGAPGSGKSVLAQLIPRFYDVTSGRITIDGQDIRSVTVASLRTTISLVQQDVFLFDTSVHENLAYTNPDTDADQVEAAARAAAVHEQILGLSAGYQSRVGERGVALSGGQRQRLAIARGLVNNPGFLVLDDATAAVDAVTESEILGRLRDTSEERATVIIAHRLSAIRDADEIILLDKGRIAERGTHQELLAREGAYAQLWQLQQQAAQVENRSASRSVPQEGIL